MSKFLEPNKDPQPKRKDQFPTSLQVRMKYHPDIDSDEKEPVIMHDEPSSGTDGTKFVIGIYTLVRIEEVTLRVIKERKVV